MPTDHSTRGPHHRPDRAILALAAAGMLALFGQTALAQQGKAPPKAPTASTSAEDACGDFPTAPKLEGDKDVDAAIDKFLNTNFEIITGCSTDTIKSIELARSGGKDWDFADQRILKQVDKNRDLIRLIQYDLIGQVQKLIAHIESSANNVDQVFKSEAEQKVERERLIKQAEALKAHVKSLTSATDDLGKEVNALERERPKLAQMMRRKEFDKIIERVAKITEATKKQAAILSKKSADLRGGPKGGVNP